MVDDLPDPNVLDDPDFLGLVVVLLFLVHKMARIRKWFTIDSNFKRPILKRTDRALRGSINELSRQGAITNTVFVPSSTK